jgi:hypothetical protein
MRHLISVVPLLCALAMRAAHAQVIVGALANGRSTFWLNAPGTSVCYIVPPEQNVDPKWLILTTLGGSEQYRQTLPAEAAGCLSLAVAKAPGSILLQEHLLAVVGPSNASLAATAPFNVSSVGLTVMATATTTAVNFTVMANPVNKALRRAGDGVRLMDKDGVAVGGCLLYQPSGFISPTQSQIKCAFGLLRPLVAPAATRGPFTVRFYSEGDASPAAVLTPTTFQAQQWVSWGL